MLLALPAGGFPESISSQKAACLKAAAVVVVVAYKVEANCRR